MRNKPDCGTVAGYAKHQRLKTPYCEPCREAHRAYRKERYPLQQKEYHAKRYKENPEFFKEKNKKSLKPELSAAKTRRYRANKLNNGSEPYTLLEVLETYGAICHLCGVAIDLTLPRRVGAPGWQLGLHIDHVIPIAQGGPDTLANVKPSHGICNISKGYKIG